MDEYSRLLAFMKIAVQNLGTLHRHLVDGAAWFSIHEELEEWYEDLGNHLDDLIEIGLVLGYRDPSIKDAVLQFGGDILEAEAYGCLDALAIARNILRSVSGMMGVAREGVPVNVQSKIDEYSYHWDKVANYKITAALKGLGDDDDD